MRNGFIIVTIIFTALFIMVRSRQASKISVEVRNVRNWYTIRAAELDDAANRLFHAVKRQRPAAEIQERFLQTRLAYKQLEVMAEYYNPVTAKAINGPNLPEAEPDNPGVVIEPEGLQVLEEMFFPNVSADTAAMRLEAQRLLANIHRLKMMAASIVTTDAHIFDAMRLELLRITALGISGFDAPIAQNSIAEAAAALNGTRDVWLFYQDGIGKKDKKLFEETNTLFYNASQALKAAKDFSAFSRMQFITAYLNPLAEKISRSREALNVPRKTEPRFFNPMAAHVFEPDAFNPAFYSSDQTAAGEEAAVELGRRLFYEPALSGNGQRTCGSCHQPDKAFTDGQRVAASLNDEPIHRNTPTLLNAALQPSQFYDQRVAYLEDQVEDVVTNKSEMHGSLEPAAALLKRDSLYRRLFREAYHGDITAAHIRKAIAAYIRSLTTLNSPFDEYMQGNRNALTASAVKGFDLFMGKAKCGTCHFVPLFNGNVPPTFEKAEAEVLGVPAIDNPHAADPDEGKYRLHRIAHHRFAFKTPTLRNIAQTAPYMHNGVYNTLEEVMEFYNNGGGAGIGITLDNQTLPTDSLHLSKEEQQDIIAFMKSLSSSPKQPVSKSLASASGR
ncbi:cytochrome-c peroxidase [Chitinophaga lutea]|uniref:Cytochrome-c peroxidase n=1 Tax=Chitinophaga lutea TaxID=2488634 RepID=A0A3N4Q360_9BACT|nr:cytochrome c peroxidase [Chitinophaga lutea]RPE13649.1 cytochrome-c peroxidase [Chitinophaga lutea]